MEKEMQLQPPGKSTRPFEEWKASLMKIVSQYNAQPTGSISDDRLKPYYDQGLMPTVAFNELFNR